MTDAELRLECIQKAVMVVCARADGHDILIPVAEKIYAFVTAAPAAPQEQAVAS